MSPKVLPVVCQSCYAKEKGQNSKLLLEQIQMRGQKLITMEQTANGRNAQTWSGAQLRVLIPAQLMRLLSQSDNVRCVPNDSIGTNRCAWDPSVFRPPANAQRLGGIGPQWCIVRLRLWATVPLHAHH